MARVLVVDDEGTVRDLVRLALEHVNVDVVVAATTAEALRAIEAQEPDLILTDLCRPEGPGPWLVEQVRAAAPRALVVAFTGAMGVDAADYCGPSRLDGYIRKPCSISDFVACVRAFLLQPKR